MIRWLEQDEHGADVALGILLACAFLAGLIIGALWGRSS